MGLETKGRGPLSMFLHQRSARRIAAAVEFVERLPPDLGRPQRRRLHVPVIRTDLVADAAHKALEGKILAPVSQYEFQGIQHDASGKLTIAPVTGRIQIGRAGYYGISYQVHYHARLGNELGLGVLDRGAALTSNPNVTTTAGGGADPLDGSAAVRLTATLTFALALEVGMELSVLASNLAGPDTIAVGGGAFTVWRLGDYVSTFTGV